jgi:hypothetical protein
VLRIVLRGLLSLNRRRARKAGIQHGRTGTVTFIQRFGSAASRNVHFHVVALDGVCAEGADGKLLFHPARPERGEVHHLVGATRICARRHLLRRGLGKSDDAVDSDPFSDASAILASCYAGSVQGRQAFGRRQGAKLQRLGADPCVSWRDIKRSLHAHVKGFDLHASRVIGAERLYLDASGQ